MKKWNYFLAAFLLAMLSAPATLSAQQADSTGLPGDHFSLEGALELFKKAGSLEDFEKALNDEDNAVNNLDLNQDGETDYIRVEDYMEGDVHAIVLQALVGDGESQDVAVIEVEKKNDEEATLQIIGDEDIYGEPAIVEPYPYDDEVGPIGENSQVSNDRSRPVHINVMTWPSVRYIYTPNYRVWVSPWHWRKYPGWYRPWRPQPWRVYHPRTVVYRPHYHVVKVHRVTTAHRYYTPRRVSSPVVHTRTATVVKARGSAQSRTGIRKSTTTVEKPRDGKVTREKTKVKGKKGGKVKREKTTIKKRKRGE